MSEKLFFHNFLKKIILFLAVLILTFNNAAGQQDTLRIKANYIAVPASLMALGVLINDQNTKTQFHSTLLNQFPNLKTRADDYLSFAPSIIDIGSTFMDKKNNNLKHVTDILIGEALMFASTKSLKILINSKRPSGGGQSFPSGHTSQAFTGATLLFHHYNDDNIYFASSGFVLASVTGLLRVTNNRHWPSDVLFGAGLGILVGHLTYKFNPFGRHQKSKNLSFSTTGTAFSVSLRF